MKIKTHLKAGNSEGVCSINCAGAISDAYFKGRENCFS
jgi:hypothetical protein